MVYAAAGGALSRQKLRRDTDYFFIPQRIKFVSILFARSLVQPGRKLAENVNFILSGCFLIDIASGEHGRFCAGNAPGHHIAHAHRRLAAKPVQPLHGQGVFAKVKGAV